jgi:hypothetical protein
MTTESLQTINQRKRELEKSLFTLIEEFQRRPECRGVQVSIINVEQFDWHNGFDPKLPEGEVNPALYSGPDYGWRLNCIGITLVIK